MTDSQVTDWYLEGIKEGRKILRETDASAKFVDERIATLLATIKIFSSTSATGQFLRGELDFWKNQLRRKNKELPCKS